MLLVNMIQGNAWQMCVIVLSKWTTLLMIRTLRRMHTGTIFEGRKDGLPTVLQKTDTTADKVSSS